MNLLPVILADSTQALFGNQWLALLAILAGVAVFMVLVALAGRWLAATHPEPAPVPGTLTSASPRVPAGTPSPELIAVIAASISAHLGAQARITAIRPAPIAPNVETLMQQWSLEGRRQIYSSHQVR